MQILIKIVISLFWIAIIIVSGCRIHLTWKKDIDVSKLRPDRLVKKMAKDAASWLPSRDKDGIYQNGKLTARVKDEEYRENNGEVLFEQLEYSNDLDTSKEFEFQKYILKIKHINTSIGVLSSAPQKGRILQKVYCEIIGHR